MEISSSGDSASAEERDVLRSRPEDNIGRVEALARVLWPFKGAPCTWETPEEGGGTERGDGVSPVDRFFLFAASDSPMGLPIARVIEHMLGSRSLPVLRAYIFHRRQ